MLLSDRPRTEYERAPAHEVICQFRFPTILSINNVEPADYQELIRADFPHYVKRVNRTAPKLSGLGTSNPKIEPQNSVNNYNFVSDDARWKINLTQNFISLSTLYYTGWEDFAHTIDRPLAAFIKTYQPASFSRIGLRYVNLFSRNTLDLTDIPWSELIAPAYLGALNEPDMPEEHFLNCATDLLFRLDSSCNAKIHAGLGRVRVNSPKVSEDPEIKFIFDMDLSMGGKLPCNLSAGAMETLHTHAGPLFEGAITDSLRIALQPR